VTRTRHASVGAVARRYVPALAALLAVVVVATLVGGGDDTPATRRPPGHTLPLPLTFDQARARGASVQWGPHCDTTTGKIAVPLWYAPPCVEPWKGPDNGGATAPGVSKDEIVVAVYQEQPDLLEQTFLQRSGSDESLSTEFKTNQQYAQFFESNYEMYGRHVKLVPVRASGPPDDDVSAKADAIRVATEIGAFASFGGPSQTTAYADELAARGVMCIGDCTIAAPESFLRSRSPYVWPTLASPDQAAEHWADFVGKELAHRKASHAGDAKTRRQTRRFGIVRYDDEPGTFNRSFARFTSLLRRQGVRTATEVPYRLDLAAAQESARATIAALRQAHVTSVILAGDPVFPTFLTKEATAQGYFPEWVVMGYAFTDTAVFGRQYDQRQWKHAFGVSLLPVRQADDIDELAQILVWQTGQPPAASTFRLLVQAQLLFFTGVHLAGPDLTPETFRAGLFRFPAQRPVRAPFLHISWGRHRIWPNLDVTGGDDATVIFWDPNARGTDEVGNQGEGLWRYALDGRRYLPGHWPAGNVGLFDRARSVTILRTLPVPDQPPPYPSPAAPSSPTTGPPPSPPGG
jgi:Periplasmic binding protein